MEQERHQTTSWISCSRLPSADDSVLSAWCADVLFLLSHLQQLRNGRQYSLVPLSDTMCRLPASTSWHRQDRSRCTWCRFCVATPDPELSNRINGFIARSMMCDTSCNTKMWTMLLEINTVS